MKKHQIFYKKLIYSVIIICCFTSCSDSDDISIDTSLFYGKWFTRERCVTDNFKIYTENKEFIDRFSLNENCDMDTFDVKESTSSFSLSGNEIYYGDESSIKTIVKGTNDNSSTDQISVQFYAERIIELNEFEMIIEIETRTSGRTNKRILNLYRTAN